MSVVTENGATAKSGANYGRYESFGDWLFQTLIVNLFLLVILLWVMGCYDHLLFVFGQWLRDMLAIKAI